MKLLKTGISIALLAALYAGCSQNPCVPGNQFVPHGSIILVDEFALTANYIVLSNGQESTLIGSSMGFSTYSSINVAVIGGFAYFLVSDSTSLVKKFDLNAGQMDGTISYGSLSYVQFSASDGNNLYMTFEGSPAMEVISLADFTTSASIKAPLQAGEGIFYTNGYLYLCLSDGSPSYTHSCMAALPVNNLQSSPVCSNVMPDPWAIDSDGAGTFYVSSEGTENTATYSWNPVGGITKISGSNVVNIVQNKSIGAIKFAAGNIYALEYGKGIDVYSPSGTLITNILSGININAIVYYNGYIYAEANSTLYKISTSGNTVVQTYNSGINDSYGCSMAVYE